MRWTGGWAMASECYMCEENTCGTAWCSTCDGHTGFKRIPPRQAQWRCRWVQVAQRGGEISDLGNLREISKIQDLRPLGYEDQQCIESACCARTCCGPIAMQRGEKRKEQRNSGCVVMQQETQKVQDWQPIGTQKAPTQKAPVQGTSRKARRHRVGVLPAVKHFLALAVGLYWLNTIG